MLDSTSMLVAIGISLAFFKYQKLTIQPSLSTLFKLSKLNSFTTK